MPDSASRSTTPSAPDVPMVPKSDYDAMTQKHQARIDQVVEEYNQETHKLHARIKELEREVERLNKAQDEHKVTAKQGIQYLTIVSEMLQIREDLSHAGDLRLDSQQVQELNNRLDQLIASLVA